MVSAPAQTDSEHMMKETAAVRSVAVKPAVPASTEGYNDRPAAGIWSEFEKAVRKCFPAAAGEQGLYSSLQNSVLAVVR